MYKKLIKKAYKVFVVAERLHSSEQGEKCYVEERGCEKPVKTVQTTHFVCATTTNTTGVQ